MTNRDRSPADLLSGADLPALAQQTIEYWVDGWQRTILFWDVLRRRSTAE